MIPAIYLKTLESLNYYWLAVGVCNGEFTKNGYDETMNSIQKAHLL